jgi:GT2 family glycosyltransferase
MPVEAVPTTEDSALHPTSFYGLTKLTQEQMTLMFGLALGLRTFSLRFQNVYGPGQSLNNPYTGILPVFSNQARFGKPIYIFEDGQESRDFVHVEDVCDATVACLKAPAVVEALNVGSGMQTTVLEIAQRVADYFASKSEIVINGAFRQGDVRHNFADLGRVQSRLGFEPKWRFSDGLRHFLDWSAAEKPRSVGYEESFHEMRARGMYHTECPAEVTTEPFLDLTIIIASYNTRELLRNCIESVYRHTQGINFEVICVDDNSPDGSATMVAKLFPQVILVRNSENRWYARNCNLGMKMSRARYACHLNSDTLLTDNAFAAMVRFMDEHPEIAACGPKLLNPDGTVQHCIRSFTGAGTFLLQALNWHKLFPNSRLMNRYYNADFDYSRPQQVQSIGTTAYVIRRSTWEQAGMFDERFRLSMVDLAYNFMLSRKGYKVYYTPCAEVIHFGGQSINQQASSSLRDQRDAFIEFSDSYDYFGSNAITKGLVRLLVWVRFYLKMFEYRLSSDKRVIKGPGAPSQECAREAPVGRS